VILDFEQCCAASSQTISSDVAQKTFVASRNGTLTTHFFKYLAPGANLVGWGVYTWGCTHGV